MTAESAHLELARRHLARVLSASSEVDWPDLALYGFYCLENAVVAAAIRAGIATQKSHPSKANAAQQLAARNRLPDVSGLLVELNDARKAEAYGDIARPEIDPADLARKLEEYVRAVEAFLAE